MTNSFFLLQLKFVKLILYVLFVCLYQKQTISKDEKTTLNWFPVRCDFTFI